MKGVEAVRHRPVGGLAQPGLWLSLEAVLALPLSARARLDLLEALLKVLDGDPGPDQDDCRAALLLALVEAQLLQACCSFEAGAWSRGRRQWQAAVAHHQALEALQPAAAPDRLLDGLIQALARLDQSLTHRRWRPPTSPREQARVHALAAELLLQIRRLGRPLPGWFAAVEEGLLRRGGLALLEQPGLSSRRQGIALLLRWRQAQSASPPWLLAALEQGLLRLLADLHQSSEPVADLQALVAVLMELPLLVADPDRQERLREELALAEGCLQLAAAAHQPLAVRECLGLQQGPLVAPAQLRRLVGEWLADHPAPGAPVVLELVWIAGARPLPHGQGQLALNLAALLPEQGGEAAPVERLLAAFFEPLQQAGGGRRWQQRPAAASLLTSLGHGWAAGAALSADACRLLALAQQHWEHGCGPAGLAAAELPAPWPQARLQPGCCLLQPPPLQLAGLRCWLLARPELAPALAEIRRHHHDPVFLEQRAACAARDHGNGLETLCALHRQEGFYASHAAPLASLQAWAESSLALLGCSQLLVAAEPWLGSWWAVLQGLTLQQSRTPELVRAPEDARLYELLAGQEVLLVSPLAELVEEQHRSGRAFTLFRDLPIAPYGLRTLAPPASCHPARPHRGFEASLAACLEAVEVLARQRPFTVFLTAAGIYDLPLCQAVRERHGASCLALGPAIHARFGIDQAGSPPWRVAQRRADRWRRIR